MFSLIFITFFVLSPSLVFALSWQESPELKPLFTELGIKEGTFVLYDVNENILKGYNKKRAETRFIPGSTYKIPNALIGLSVGAVKNVDEVLPYGGQPQPIKAWEHDMSLRDAIKMSNVPIYQELARRIGLINMWKLLDKLNFGNDEVLKPLMHRRKGLGVVAIDRFWLDGPLKISAVEQVEFLKRLALGELPVDKEIQQSVREILKLEQGENWALFGKTGAVDKYNPSLGWWVGWVEKEGRVYIFALNIDMLDNTYFERRISLGKNCLKKLGVLP
ncbi:class D beta-lactamase [Desulfovibrio litoralis]|uniref:class D beta-lactamase n=1 Tax=Desulfovibrio litoralis TaxID=466107 RepID=UPI003CCBD23B